LLRVPDHRVCGCLIPDVWLPDFRREREGACERWRIRFKVVKVPDWFFMAPIPKAEKDRCVLKILNAAKYLVNIKMGF